MRKQIGRYSVTAEIGKGGFGTVYRAHDPIVRRDVAIKVLAGSDDADLVARFRSEASTAGNLHHKNIVTVYEFAEQDGVCYLVMELLEGVELRHVIVQTPPPGLLEKVELMTEVAEGLTFAHQRGIVHRDIKPANIMRLSDGTAKILDFGIARVMLDTSSRLTKTGSIVGTVPYMAPEQFSEGVTGVSTDIWAFGVVFYEFLTGKQPFDASEASAVMYRVLNHTPEPIRVFLPDCPSQLEALIQRLLTKNRLQRPQFLDDIILDLRLIARQLGLEQIPGLLQRATQLIDGGAEEEARPLLRRALTLDPANPAALDWQKKLQAASQRSAIRPKIEELLRLAADEAVRRDYGSAIAKVEFALELDPGSPTLRNRLSELQSMERRHVASDRLAQQAEQTLAGADVTAALVLAHQALASDPENPNALKVLSAAETALRERAQGEAVQAAVSEARKLMEAGAFAEAVHALTDLASNPRATPEVPLLLADARRALAVEAQVREFQQSLVRAEALLDIESVEEALAVLRKLQSLQPADEAVLQLVERANLLAQRHHDRERVDGLLNLARLHATEGDLDAAANAVEEALRILPEHPTSLEARAAIIGERKKRELEHAKKEELKREAAAVSSLLAASTIDQAEQAWRSLASRYPDAPEVAKLRGEIAALSEIAALKGKAVMEQQAQQSQQVRGLLAEGRGAAAIEKLHALAGQFPDELWIADLLREAHAQVARAAEESCSAVENALEFEDFQRASDLCHAALKLNRGDDRFGSLLRRAELGLKLRKCLQKSRLALQNAQFDQALRALGEAGAENAQHPEIAALRAQIEQQALDHQRDAERERGRTQVRRLMKAEDFAGALAEVKKWIERFPDDHRFREDFAEAQKQLDYYEKRRALVDTANEARLFIDKGEFGKALELIDEALRTAPGDLALLHLRESALAAEQLRHRRLDLDAAISDLEAKFRVGAANEVKSNAEALLKQQEDPRIRELLNWAVTSLQQSDAIRRRGASDGKGKKVAVILSVPAVLVVAVVWGLRDKQPPPPPPQPPAQPSKIETAERPMTIRPAELDFRYRMGAGIPGAQTVHVEAGSQWSAQVGDAWLKLEPAVGQGASEVRVVVSPEKLSAGDYSGVVLLTRPDGVGQPLTLRVRLHVDAANIRSDVPTVGSKTSVQTQPSQATTQQVPGASGTKESEIKGAGPSATPQNSTTSVNTIPSYPAPPRPVDCNASDYPGTRRGGFRWSGRLEPGSEIAFGRRPTFAILAGGGALVSQQGGGLPGCDSALTVQPTAGLQVVEGPSVGNNFARIVLKNTSGNLIQAITIDWRVR